VNWGWVEIGEGSKEKAKNLKLKIAYKNITTNKKNKNEY
jgi:hypothetical protein